MQEIERVWKKRNTPYGVSIGNDMLIKGEYVESVPPYVEKEEIVTETGDFSDDSYYLIMDINGYCFGSIEEVSQSSDLSMYYYD